MKEVVEEDMLMECLKIEEVNEALNVQKTYLMVMEKAMTVDMRMEKNIKII